eukprot:gb/GECH01011085.1/.p1 GENE.gb/GECH01011085.1/~~gb/GECH01011085.1/.p1  ORF type:complete len:314 (+),score=44.00 gb/GECH01011085.1/:1-942(+)
MKTAALVALLAAIIPIISAETLDDKPVLDNDIIDKVNKGNHGWKADRNSKFEGMTIGEARKFLSTMLVASDPEGVIPDVREIDSTHSIPQHFDSRDEWKNCIHPIRNQEKCGGCWAFAASEVLSDRFCIASGGSTDVVLSPQKLISCDHRNYGCNGGIIPVAWKYLEQSGDCTDDCMPYTSGGGTTGSCPSSCSDGSSPQNYYAKSGSSRQFSSVGAIQQEIMNHGPVEAGFQVYQDFFSYKSGVYTHQYGGLAGGHAIKIVGWGVDSKSNQPYWIVANSWGASWGMNGYFWILRGSDECGIEDQVFAGQAKV